MPMVCHRATLSWSMNITATALGLDTRVRIRGPAQSHKLTRMAALESRQRFSFAYLLWNIRRIWLSTQFGPPEPTAMESYGITQADRKRLKECSSFCPKRQNWFSVT